MTYDEVIEWFWDDSEKKNSDYKGIVDKFEYNKRKDVNDALNEFKKKANSLGDKKLQTAINNVGEDAIIDYQDNKVVIPNNENWKENAIRKIKNSRTMSELDEALDSGIQDDIDNKKYEQDIIKDVTREIEVRRSTIVPVPTRAEIREKEEQERDIEKIKQAKTQADLADISFSGRPEVREAWYAQQGKIDSLEQEFISSVKSETSISRLQNLRDKAPTTKAEDAIDIKIRELEQSETE